MRFDSSSPEGPCDASVSSIVAFGIVDAAGVGGRRCGGGGGTSGLLRRAAREQRQRCEQNRGRNEIFHLHTCRHC